MLTRHYQTELGRSFMPAMHRNGRPASSCRGCQVRELALCAALSDDELAALEAVQTRQNVGRGQIVCYEGDSADIVYNVAAGTLRLSKLLADGRRQVTGFLLAGDFVGLMDADEYACTAEAVEDVKLCRIERRAFERLTERFPGLERQLRARLTHALAESHAHMLLLGQRSPREKLAYFLLRLHERLSSGKGAAQSLRLPMKRADIADFLGLTIETVSRTFTVMRQEGLISLPEPQLVIFEDRDGIEGLAA
jgi:CRP/FNR family transcriptional regulator, anaerobic regulatory protein